MLQFTFLTRKSLHHSKKVSDKNIKWTLDLEPRKQEDSEIPESTSQTVLNEMLESGNEDDPVSADSLVTTTLASSTEEELPVPENDKQLAAEELPVPGNDNPSSEEELLVPENNDPLPTYETKAAEELAPILEENATTEKAGIIFEEELSIYNLLKKPAVDEADVEKLGTKVENENLGTDASSKRLGTKMETFGNRVTVIRKGKKRTRFENFEAGNDIKNEDTKQETLERQQIQPNRTLETIQRQQNEPGQTLETLQSQQNDSNQTLGTKKPVPSRFEPTTKNLQNPVFHKSIGQRSFESTKSSNK